jgi:hypothetical protein
MNTPMSPPDFNNLRVLKVLEERFRRELAEAIKSPDPIVRQDALTAYDVVRKALDDAYASIQERLREGG